MIFLLDYPRSFIDFYSQIVAETNDINVNCVD